MQIAFENRKNPGFLKMRSHSRDGNSRPIDYDYYVWTLKQKKAEPSQLTLPLLFYD